MDMKIWSWRTERTLSEVGLNHQYQPCYLYRVYDRTTGDLLHQGFKQTLPAAKNRVFTLVGVETNRPLKVRR